MVVAHSSQTENRMTASDDRTPYEKWQDTIKPAKTDARWNEHDGEITAALGEFRVHLSAISTGYVGPKASLIKAMIWTESGGRDAPAWQTRPMQIGNASDPGYAALMSDTQGGELILPAGLKAKLTVKTLNTPSGNIRAGIGYLLLRGANYETISVLDKLDTKRYEYTVKSGDSLDKIMRAQGTTMAVLNQLNPGVGAAIKPGQKLLFQKASMKKIIKSWQAIDVNFAAKKYNTKDTRYADKLNYCLTFFAA
jgi:hypothetical protein